MKDGIAVCQSNNTQYILLVPPAITLTQAVVDAIGRGDITLQFTDEDTAVDLAMEWVEGETHQVVDIDKSADDLTSQLADETVKVAVNGATELCDDPGLFVATPEQVKGMAAALAGSTVSAELDEVLGILTDFYTDAANTDRGVAILFN